MECVLDVPVVNQIVWRFDGPVPQSALDAMWHNLDAGPINRTVQRVHVPGARDKWVRATAPSLPLHTDSATVPASDLTGWMQERAAVRLDPLNGPVWQLATASLGDGGSIVSLVASHVVGDGGALTSAAIAALQGPGEPDDFRTAWDHVGERDVRDALGQLAAATSGAATALVRTVRGARGGGKAASGPTTSVVSVVDASVTGPFVPSTVVVDCDASQWADTARRAGGSANSLLVAIALGVLTASGRVDESDAVRVSLPVSTRVPGDVRANATSGVSIHVDGGAGWRTDLGPIRRDSKTAFTTLSDATRSTFDLTKPLMQMLPDKIVEKAAASGTAPLCLCSNLGPRGSMLCVVGDVAARSVAMRSITQNTTAELLRRTKGGVSVWWNTSGERATLCVTGLDPDRFPTRSRLRELVDAECRRWELTPEFW